MQVNRGENRDDYKKNKVACCSLKQMNLIHNFLQKKCKDLTTLRSQSEVK